MICPLLIGAEGAKTPAGAAGQVSLLGALAPRRLTARPAESEAPGAEINRSLSIDNLILKIGI
ncbi:hypothetical protein B1NLA3E_03645 [Bacillus sp. 1NLA3E]|nr:hypothetical protein B1NLA3E_03645 [Bacillus sp. 1NLA3E]